jgi:uncharacterized protein YcbK (DUF882 family)
MNYTYFSLSEFASPDLPDSGVNMDSEFLTKLDNARAIANIRFHITSGYRTKEYNEDLRKRGYKASPDSAHLTGHAADIAATSGKERWTIVNALIRSGFNRIGIAKSFIHVDDDPSKPTNVIWTY